MLGGRIQALAFAALAVALAWLFRGRLLAALPKREVMLYGGSALVGYLFGRELAPVFFGVIPI